MSMEKLTIIHISDLHRSRDNPITNISLLSSLIRDIDLCEKEGVSRPDLVIVSGDIVQGSANLKKAVAEIQEQYKEALGFLNDLAQHFFDGDKSRIIITPGNHDVCWVESIDSMEVIDESKVICEKGRIKKEIFQEAMKINSRVKWSWPDRSFYRISDMDKYNQRLSYFCDFYSEFYNEKRSYSLNPEEQFDVFDFSELGISIVGFNSCFHNDHLNRAGSINPQCLAMATLRLRELNEKGRFILATWHHNTKGKPYDQDYMDGTFIQNLIADNVRIGLHGHQHKLEIIREENNIIDNKVMHILSSGSLCAGPSELPTGYNQQYNILELCRLNDEEIELKVLSRVKTPDSSYDNPIWDAGTFNSTSTQYKSNIKHSLPPGLSLGALESLIGKKEYAEAFNALIKLDLDDVLVRVLLLECCERLDDFSAIAKYFIDPINSAEAVALLSACLDLGDKELFRSVLDTPFVAGTKDPSVLHFRNQLERKLS